MSWRFASTSACHDLPTLCRSIQLLAQLARGDAAEDLEILFLRHQPSQD